MMQGPEGAVLHGSATSAVLGSHHRTGRIARLLVQTGNIARRRLCFGWQLHPATPEPGWAEAGVRAPEIVAREVEVLPAERGEVGEQRIGDQVAATARGIEGAAEIDGVPQRDGGRNGPCV